MKNEIVKVPISAKRLDIALKFRGWTRAELADHVGISLSTVRRSMKAGQINEAYLPKICSILGVNEKFLSGDKEMDRVARAMAMLVDYFDTLHG